jgi:tRNA(His) 5'-end guanylyltransferase
VEIVADDIGDRFKAYEACWDFSLPRRMPLVIRVDGRGFHGLKLQKPFDHDFFRTMAGVAEALCREIQGAVLAYVQSDEISVIARDDVQPNTEAWLGKRLSKVISLAAATATAAYNERSHMVWDWQQFDARAFVLPDLSEVTNYLIWRQQDATRNSVSMAAHAAFSHKSLQGVNSNGMLDRLRKAGKPWEETPTHFKRGAVVRRVKVPKYVEFLKAEVWRSEWDIHTEPPIFTQDRAYIEELYREPESAVSPQGNGKP